MNNEEYLIDDFNEEENYDEETGDNIKTREIMLTSPGKNLKKLKQKFAVNYNNDNKSIQLTKTSEKSEKFNDGFSYEKSSVMVSYSEDDQEDIENNEIEYEINEEPEGDSEEDW
ncbi:hypothetical protein HY212_02880 [Candidatus Pacearchaeota archaeon]|nr:hypothetical protein [Candidatus Pacearchaeota archaeon]